MSPTKSETHALAGIHLDIQKGEYLSIAGPSGCGKSTLLAILGLLDSPSDGTYILNSKPVQNLKLSERARIRNREIGFIFQAFNLIGDLTVYENVELPLTYRGMPGAAERKKRVHEALERVGMSHRVKHYPSQLSGGQQQRVAVARALAGDPSILLADEPTGNLDSANGEAVMDLLRELHHGGATICMVTHQIPVTPGMPPLPAVVNATMEGGNEHDEILDWSQCPAVESIPGKVSGAWVFKDTLMPVATVFVESEAGLTAEEVTEEFSVTRPSRSTRYCISRQRVCQRPFRHRCIQRRSMLILFDHGTPRSIARWLPRHTVVEAIARGWGSIDQRALC